MPIVNLAEHHLAMVNTIEQSRHPYPWPPADIARAMTKPYRTFVYETEEGFTAGFAVFYWLQHSADLMNIAVAESHLRLGIAEKLLRHGIALAEANKLEQLLLEVRASNAAAISLYEKLGFVEIDRRRGYYPVKPAQSDASTRRANLREDAIVMSKAIAMAFDFS